MLYGVLAGTLIVLSSCSKQHLKSSTSIPQIIKKDTWNLIRGVSDEYPFFLRYRPQITPDVEITDYSQLVMIFWPYETNSSGMPSNATSERTKIFEDRLVPALEDTDDGVLVGVVTWKGTREWIFYVKSIDVFSDALHFMPQEEEPYPISIETENDPEWKYYFEGNFQTIIKEASQKDESSQPTE